MILSDIFSTSFMFSIGIIIILIGVIFAFISYRMAEQDHKITSMLGLISTMAEELQFFRSKLALVHNKQMEGHTDTSKLLYQGGSNNTDLISVSDDEEVDSDEEVDEEADSDIDSDEDSDEDSDDEEVDSNNECTIHYNISSEPINLCIDSEEILDTNESTTMIKTIHLEEPINLLSDELNMDEYQEINESTDFKTIPITSEEIFDKADYKKMPLNKLRELVVEKGLTSNASKLKKNELLKIIEG